MDDFAAILVLAIVVEALVEIITRLGGRWATRIPTQAISIVLGVIVAVAYNADLLCSLGVCARAPVIGNIVTGLFISRGSNYIHELTARLTLLGKASPTNVTSHIDESGIGFVAGDDKSE